MIREGQLWRGKEEPYTDETVFIISEEKLDGNGRPLPEPWWSVWMTLDIVTVNGRRGESFATWLTELKIESHYELVSDCEEQ